MSVLVNDSGSVRVGVLMPEEVPNLVLNWDPYYTAYSNGNNVTTWNDVISSSLLTVNSPYVFNANVLNSYPVMDGVGVNRVLYSAADINSALSGDFTFFIVVKQSASSPLTNFILSDSPVNGGFRLSSSSSYTIAYNEFNGSGATSFSLQNADFKMNTNNYTIVCVNVKRGGDGYIRSSLSKRIKASSNVPAYTSPSSTITRFGNTAGEINFKTIGGMFFFNRSLTEREETGIFRGLQLKYKI